MKISHKMQAITRKMCFQKSQVRMVPILVNAADPLERSMLHLKRKTLMVEISSFQGVRFKLINKQVVWH
jgi:hypothetical protein